jgi:CubicO group peptidase (beta-lactamase class C family)
MPSRSFRLPCCTLASFLLAGIVFLAQAPAQPPLLASRPPVAPQTPAPSGLRDRAELEAFIDGVMAAQKEADHIEGATVAVVANGELFFAKGYGHADRAAGKKVDPDRTLFRIGSVSKLFTWTAVMQQVEQGKLDLNADVNTYLAGSPVHVPDLYPQQPITMMHLMTHTAGFEDYVIGLFARTPAAMRPLGDVLADQLPARVRPPGQLSSYSNHGTALAGYIVERLSGVPFEQYVEKQILAPLQMAHTTARQPVPEVLAPDMSVGYRFAAGQYNVESFEYVPAFPAGAMSASAVDMTHFMIAHLQDGRYENARMLSEATARRMHSRLFGHAAGLNGMLHGFLEMNRNGHRIYGHGGDTLWFHTELALLPDDHVGIFVSYNCDSGASARTAVVKAFVDRYFPDTSPSRPVATRTGEPAGTFAGSYRSIRVSYTSMAKVAALLGAVSVSELSDGRLLTSGLGGLRPRRWVPVAPLLFRDAEGDDQIAFLKDAPGRVSHLVVGFPAVAFERLGVMETPLFHGVALAASLVLLASALVAWPIMAWRGRRHRTPETPSRWARLLVWMTALLLIAFFLTLLGALRDPLEIAFGVPNAIRVALALPLVAVVLTVVALAFVALAWTRRYWGLAGRIYYSMVAASAVVCLAVLFYWNLLGYHFR